MAVVNILVGSVTGSAQSAAEEVQVVLREHGIDNAMYQQPTIDQVTDDSQVLLVVTSSTGQGDLPPFMAQLYVQLQDQFPLIPHKHFAVLALGDSSYATYCQGGATMEETFYELQGQALCDRYNIDALEHYDPVDEARQWALNCVERINERLAA